MKCLWQHLGGGFTVGEIWLLRVPVRGLRVAAWQLPWAAARAPLGRLRRGRSIRNERSCVNFFFDFRYLALVCADTLAYAPSSRR